MAKGQTERWRTWSGPTAAARPLVHVKQHLDSTLPLCDDCGSSRLLPSDSVNGGDGGGTGSHYFAAAMITVAGIA